MLTKKSVDIKENKSIEYVLGTHESAQHTWDSEVTQSRWQPIPNQNETTKKWLITATQEIKWTIHSLSLRCSTTYLIECHVSHINLEKSSISKNSN